MYEAARTGAAPRRTTPPAIGGVFSDRFCGRRCARARRLHAVPRACYSAYPSDLTPVLAYSLWCYPHLELPEAYGAAVLLLECPSSMTVLPCGQQERYAGHPHPCLI